MCESLRQLTLMAAAQPRPRPARDEGVSFRLYDSLSMFFSSSKPPDLLHFFLNLNALI